MERSRGKADTGARGVSPKRHELSRIFLQNERNLGRTRTPLTPDFRLVLSGFRLVRQIDATDSVPLPELPHSLYSVCAVQLTFCVVSANLHRNASDVSVGTREWTPESNLAVTRLGARHQSNRNTDLSACLLCLISRGPPHGKGRP